MAKRIALIVTVRNEQLAISNLLESISAQTKKPDEIIITDAGSTDATKKEINKFKNILPQIQLIEVGDVNRSIGRNIAIKKAKSHIIAITDAGCILKKDWLQKITKPIISGEAESVAGFYLTDDSSLFAKATAPFISTMPGDLDSHTYLPSSRSIAFTRESWEKAGKYPDHLNYCEDLVFAKSLKNISNMVVHPSAVVFWHHTKSPWGFVKQIRNYATGDVRAKYVPHIKKILTVYIRYIVFLFFPILLIPYIFWAMYKMRKFAKPKALLLYFPFVQFLTDFGVLWGSAQGFFARFFK